jgi:hypothetical protein
MPTLPAWINPLKCFDLEPSVPGEPPVPTAEALFRWLFSPREDAGVEAFARRYREIDAGGDQLFAVPDEPHIVVKLVLPLLHAKGAYALGDYLGCLALAGTVGEMVAILLWDISKVEIRGMPLDEEMQRTLFGREFERLGQEARIRVLSGLGLIDDDTEQALTRLKNTRNRHLHLLSEPLSKLPGDARQAYADALKAASFILAQSVSGGAVVFRADLRAYLSERGVMRDDPPAAAQT